MFEGSVWLVAACGAVWYCWIDGRTLAATAMACPLKHVEPGTS